MHLFRLFITTLTSLVLTTHLAAEVTSLGSFGQAELSWPRGMARDATGRLYVGDFNLGLDVEVFAADRTPLGAFGGPQLERPGGIVVDAAGIIYVADFDGGHIDRFDSSFNHLGSFGQDYLGTPAGIVLAPDGSLIVADLNDGHLDRFDAQGIHLQTFGEGQTRSPALMALDDDGTLYVGDRYKGEIDVYDAEFNYLRSFGNESLHGATGIAIDAIGRIHVGDLEDDEIDVFDRAGNHLSTYGRLQLDAPTDIIVEPTGMIYVSDTFGNEIEQFFDSEAWVSGSHLFENVRVGTSPLAEYPEGTVGLGSSLTLTATQSLTVEGVMTIEPGSSVLVQSSRLALSGWLDVRLSEESPSVLAQDTLLTLIQTNSDGLIDFANFKGLVAGSRFVIEQLDSRELTVRYNSQVPEPGTLWLLVIGLIASPWNAKIHHCTTKNVETIA